MGAQLTKGEATVDGKAVADKANGQVRIYKHFCDWTTSFLIYLNGILSIQLFLPSYNSIYLTIHILQFNIWICVTFFDYQIGYGYNIISVLMEDFVLNTLLF